MGGGKKEAGGNERRTEGTGDEEGWSEGMRHTQSARQRGLVGDSNRRSQAAIVTAAAGHPQVDGPQWIQSTRHSNPNSPLGFDPLNNLFHQPAGHSPALLFSHFFIPILTRSLTHSFTCLSTG
eukprot:GHVU01031083.1.p2 GENE.GHVU01031083.1~~GHVU01031083.1.p2  ORF type:complete len:123 (+),score=9.44 GHVU01031083.1:424-792(+)